jgi:hypothetical protein
MDIKPNLDLRSLSLDELRRLVDSAFAETTGVDGGTGIEGAAAQAVVDTDPGAGVIALDTWADATPGPGALTDALLPAANERAAQDIAAALEAAVERVLGPLS